MELSWLELLQQAERDGWEAGSHGLNASLNPFERQSPLAIAWERRRLAAVKMNFETIMEGDE